MTIFVIEQIGVGVLSVWTRLDLAEAEMDRLIDQGWTVRLRKRNTDTGKDPS